MGNAANLQVDGDRQPDQEVARMFSTQAMRVTFQALQAVGQGQEWAAFHRVAPLALSMTPL
jgi:hypothetical protein